MSPGGVVYCDNNGPLMDADNVPVFVMYVASSYLLVSVKVRPRVSPTINVVLSVVTDNHPD